MKNQFETALACDSCHVTVDCDSATPIQMDWIHIL